MPFGRVKYPIQGHPLSRRTLRNTWGHHSPLMEFLKFYARRDTVFMFDDFDGDTIDLNYYAVAKQGGTSDANFAIAVAEDGTIAGTTGTDDNNAHSLIGPLIWFGDRYAGMECRFKFNAVTSLNFEVGFISGVPGSSAPLITDIDTPAATASHDGAVLHLDTDQTLATLAFATVGQTAGQDCAKTSLLSASGNLAPGLTDGNLPVANTYMTVRIELAVNDAYCWVNGRLVASHNTDAEGALEGGTGLAPWLYCRSRAGSAARIMTVDYLSLWKDRNATVTT